ncbi:MAG TPA: hypothetical protein VMM60_10760 [Ilumatobacter sp.]|nr:hypothetical protein [Ilumatobacter sp.]
MTGPLRVVLAVSELSADVNPGKPHPDDKLKQQIDRDRALLDASDVPIEQVTWHFFASDVSGYIADDPLLFDYLRANNIPYEIHLP